MSDRHQAAAEIRDRIDDLAGHVTDRQFQLHPEMAARYGADGRARCIEDARFHLSFLATTVETGVDAIFTEYVAWAKTVLATRKVPADDLQGGLAIIADVLRSRLKSDLTAEAIRVIETTAATISSMPSTVETFLDPSTESGALAKEYLDALLTLNSQNAMRVIADALMKGMSTTRICVDVLEPVQHEVGRLWQLNKISVAVEHFCSSVTQQVLSQIGTFRRVQADPSRKRVVALCAPGELHEIGLRAITQLLSLDGWHTVHLGANVPAIAAAQMCADWKAQIVLISATLPTHIRAVSEVIAKIRAHEVLRDTRVLVGGRAFRSDPDLWRVTGADGSAATASDLADQLK